MMVCVKTISLLKKSLDIRILIYTFVHSEQNYKLYG